MSKRQKEWARRAYDRLMDELGGDCAHCGDDGSESRLEFDCIVPQGDRHHRMEWSTRVSFYRAQARAGNLQVLCARCNNEKSHRDRRQLQSREFSDVIRYATRGAPRVDEPF